MLGGGRVGTLEAGRLADLILVDGDPTADITVLQERRRIVALGGALGAEMTVRSDTRAATTVAAPARADGGSVPVVGTPSVSAGMSILYFLIFE